MDANSARRAALEKRGELQEEAQAMGISEDFISHLVDRFYDRVRSDWALGPIFDGVVRDRWPEHMRTMKAFWNSVALRTGTYSGKPMQAHRVLRGVKPEHFAIWLRLFEETLHETAPNTMVIEYFMGYANNISERLIEVCFNERTLPLV